MKLPEREEIRELVAVMEKMKRLHPPKGHMGGLKRGEFMTLMGVKDLIDRSADGKINVSDLACRHNITPSAMSQALSALEGKGLIRRTPSTRDRRVVRVEVTPEGEEMLHAVYDHFQSYVVSIVERLGEADTKKLAELLNRLYDIVQQLNEDEKGTTEKRDIV